MTPGHRAAHAGATGALPGRHRPASRRDCRRTVIQEGAAAVSLRDPGWKHKTEVRDEFGGRWENGRYTLTFKNQAADRRLQAADAKPIRGTTSVVRSCDGSDLQR